MAGINPTVNPGLDARAIRCSLCGENLPSSKFSFQIRSNQNREAGWCSECSSARKRDIRKANGYVMRSKKYADSQTLPCISCGVMRSRSEFYASVRKSGRANLDSRCVYCRRAAAQAQRKTDPNRFKRWYASVEKDPVKTREKNLRVLYGISLEEYDAILRSQLGRCAICGKPPEAGKVLSVDHSHETDQVRGLLCRNCNFAIGLLEDNPDYAIKAAEYLRRVR